MAIRLSHIDLIKKNSIIQFHFLSYLSENKYDLHYSSVEKERSKSI
jgi:hypothetical protein